MSYPPKKILVIAPAWIGDMIMAHTFFQLLKKEHPHAVIDVVAPLATLPLTQRMKEISTAFDLPVKHRALQLKKRLQLGKLLREHHYDQAIVLPNSFKSALIPLFAKIPMRTGWLGEQRYGILNDYRRLNKEKLPRMVQRYAALALEKNAVLPEKLPMPLLSIDEKNREQALQQLELTTEKPILALCPGAEYGPAKRWPLEHFSALARHYIQQGGQVWIFGGPKDREAGEMIAAQAGKNSINLAGKTTLLMAIDLLSCAESVVTNDSGLMHIAAALKKPLVALYGSSSPDYTPPLSLDAKIIDLNLGCSPCFKRVCPLKGDAHMRCLKDITPAMVESAIKKLLE